MSVWGVIFLGLLGIFFYVKAVNLFPDLHFEEDPEGFAPSITTTLVFFFIFSIKSHKHISTVVNFWSSKKLFVFSDT